MADLSIEIELNQDFVMPPPAPLDDFAATGFDSTTVDLGWVDNNANSVSYDIEYGTDPTFTAVTEVSIGATPLSGSTHPITGLAGGTLYYFRMRARNASGVSGWVDDSASTL